MPKLKSHKGTAKRVKRTPTGKILRRRSFGTHNQAKKSESRKRTINTSAEVSGSTKQNIKRALGV